MIGFIAAFFTITINYNSSQTIKYCTVLAVLVGDNRLSHAIVHTFFTPDFTVGITIALLQLKNCRTDCLSTYFLFGGQVLTS
jgi:hypothetical protein